MDKRIASPVHVVVTGASSGIGSALADLYAGEGARLTLFGRDRPRLEHVAGRCRTRGVVVTTCVCDVADHEALSAELIAADDRAPVTHVFANAGIGGALAMAPSDGESGAVARALFETNVVGLANTVTPLLPRMVSRRAGRIAIISSLAAYTGLPQSPAYSASKAAARTYGEGLRRLVGPAGVSVTIVCPGFVETPMSDSLATPRPFLVSPQDAARRIARAVANGRAELAFPWPLTAAVKAAGWLPRPIADGLLRATYAWSRR